MCQSTSGTGRDGAGWPLLPSTGWGPPSPTAISPPRAWLFREGGAAGHPRWHWSMAGTLAGQEGSGAREDFADAVVLQDLKEI